MESNLPWITIFSQLWKIIVLILLTIAMIGPWAFDVINVPSEYPCSAPFIRLEGDYCGVPLSGINIFVTAAAGIINLISGIVTGTVDLSDGIREDIFILSVFLLILPFVDMLLMFRREDSRPRQISHLVMWGLAAGMSVLWGISSISRSAWALWGFWLYSAVVACALIIQVLGLMQTSRRIQE